LNDSTSNHPHISVHFSTLLSSALLFPTHF
jgi:hypothetical protein